MFKSLSESSDDGRPRRKKANKDKKRRGTLLKTKDDGDSLGDEQLRVRLKIFKTKEIVFAHTPSTQLSVKLAIEKENSDVEQTQFQYPDQTDVYEWNEVFDLEMEEVDSSVLTIDLITNTEEIMGRGVIYFNKLDIKQENTALFWLGLYENVKENPKRVARLLMELKPLNFSLSPSERLLIGLQRKKQL